MAVTYYPETPTAEETNAIIYYTRIGTRYGVGPVDVSAVAGLLAEIANIGGQNVDVMWFVPGDPVPADPQPINSSPPPPPPPAPTPPAPPDQPPVYSGGDELIILIETIYAFLEQIKVTIQGGQETGCTCAIEITAVATAIGLVAQSITSITTILQSKLGSGGQGGAVDLTPIEELLAAANLSFASISTCTCSLSSAVATATTPGGALDLRPVVAALEQIAAALTYAGTVPSAQPFLSWLASPTATLTQLEVIIASYQ